jgi:hypothetical protein
MISGSTFSKRKKNRIADSLKTKNAFNGSIKRGMSA